MLCHHFIVNGKLFCDTNSGLVNAYQLDTQNLLCSYRLTIHSAAYISNGCYKDDLIYVTLDNYLLALSEQEGKEVCIKN